MQSSSKVEEEEEKKVITLEKLHQKFLNLQQEWDNFKKYSSNRRSRSSRPFRRSSKSPTNDHTVQTSTSSTTTLNLPHMNNINIISPRNLMSSLQTNTSSSSSSSEMWKVNDSAVKEILRDRREAIERGSLKGRRRLFDSQVGLEDQAQEIDISEVGSALSFDEYDNYNDDDKDPFGSRDDYHADHVPLCFEEREMVVAEKMSVGDHNKRERSYDMGFKRWIGVVCVIFAIFIIRSFGEFHDDNGKVILVPT